MKLEPEVVKILSQRYEMLARLDPAGFGRRALLTLMTYLENGQKRVVRAQVFKRHNEWTFVKFEADYLYKCSYFQAGDIIILCDGGITGIFWSVGYWKAHVDFESMTWEDLKNWKPLKEGEYEELLALVSQKPKFWVIEKIKSLFFSK